MNRPINPDELYAMVRRGIEVTAEAPYACAAIDLKYFGDDENVPANLRSALDAAYDAACREIRTLKDRPNVPTL